MLGPSLTRIFALSFVLMACLKGHDLKHHHTFMQGSPALSLKQFQAKKSQVTQEELVRLKLWESILTGKSRALGRELKDQYQQLGISHIFTPSGFHLSAISTPIFKLVSKREIRLTILFLLALFIFQLPGQAALKRMSLIKLKQLWFGKETGFILAITIDVLAGGFTIAPMSFTLSFLFLSLIYSSQSKFSLIFWFFYAQFLLGYFFGTSVPLLILVINPILNLCFAISMPFLFALALPLWEWQLWIGLKLISLLQNLVNIATSATQVTPALEPGILLLIIPWLRIRWIVVCILITSNSLNLDRQKIPSPDRYHLRPQSEVIRIKNQTEKDIVYYAEAICERKLIRGFWWEKCSPRRRSSLKKSRKLSYP